MKIKYKAFTVIATLLWIQATVCQSLNVGGCLVWAWRLQGSRMQLRVIIVLKEHRHQPPGLEVESQEGLHQPGDQDWPKEGDR